jgi:glutamine---fructose-6-phosphate transaminase (isomerizing)
MCGIVGILGNEHVVPLLIEALKRLEYRGYDSAGVATNDGGRLDRRRAKGKIMMLEAELETLPLTGTAGIGHTRWATHGVPSLSNAHPHQSTGVVVVHNGIIENFAELRAELQEDGHVFETETDTEAIAHLIGHFLKSGATPMDAIKNALKRMEGAFAIATLFEGEDDLMIGARKGSPLVIGLGDGENFLGSDALAVAPFTNRVIYLDEGDWCVVRRNSHEIFDEHGVPAERPVAIIEGAAASAEKGNFRHFMQKEIFEQPVSCARTVKGYTDTLSQRIMMPPGTRDAIDFSSITGIHMVACGTAHYACCVAEYWFEQLAGLPVKTDIASEFRYRQPVVRPGELMLVVSQSGETADTLAALRYGKANGLKTAAVVNVPTSTMAREADVVLPTLAGPEIGVASTKAFTAQLCALAAAAIAAAASRGRIDREREHQLSHALIEVPRLIGEALELDEPIAALATDIAKASDVIYLGRGPHYPIALEGALKLKEVSYIHAEGYASGELKHGPIALIDENTPVVFVAPFDNVFEKSLSNLHEVAARRGPVMLISDAEGVARAGDAPSWSLTMPACDPYVAPIIYSIPIQLLAYHVAVEKGTDVDQPRNLAKSVTVE